MFGRYYNDPEVEEYKNSRAFWSGQNELEKADDSLYLEQHPSIERINTPENIALMQKYPHSADGIAEGLISLRRLNLLNEETKVLINQYPCSVDAVVFALESMGEKFVTQENLSLVFKFVQNEYGFNLKLGMRSLEMGEQLTAENFYFLVENVEHASKICVAINRLDEAKLLNAENRKLISQHAKYADSLSAGISILSKAKLLDENRNLIIKYAQHAEGVAAVIVKFVKEKFCNAFDFQFILQYPEYTVSIKNAFEILEKVKLGNEKNYRALIKCAKYSKGIAEVLERFDSTLSFQRFKITLTDEIFEQILKHGEHCEEFCKKIEKMGWCGRDSNVKEEAFFLPNF